MGSVGSRLVLGSLKTPVVAEMVSKNLAKPQNSLGGYLIMQFLKERNAVLETNAVKLCNIQPHYKVLEVGFGPGIGLQHAYRCIKDGSGHVYGVDISDKSIKDASKYLKKEINEGKVTLHLESVTNMPLETNMIDSIFHCNCYYFWPDMDQAVQELYRVIKPDGQMVTTMTYERLEGLEEKGFMKYGNIKKDRYMRSLEKHGFVDVKYNELKDVFAHVTTLLTLHNLSTTPSCSIAADGI